MSKKKEIILICVAHRDDETLGCGSIIQKHILNKDSVYCISMTDGVSSRLQKNSDLKKKNRIANSIKASKILGFKWIDIGEKFPDNQLDKVALLKIIKVIEKIKKKIKPTIIYTHNPGDLNIDHRIVTDAVMTAFRPLAKENWKKIIAFEIPSSTDYSYYDENKIFTPNYIVNIEKFWLKKKLALLAYKSEIKKFPNSRSIQGIYNLAKIRGVQNGFKLAEAFKILKEINR
jgi:LmbE family N-acetylglucosaminyl deacetylase